MNISQDSTSPRQARHAIVTGGAPLPARDRPSFAEALRQRGLLAKATLSGGITSGWTGASDTWLAVSAIYESHLRRTLMEQAQALLRGDAASEEAAV